MIVDQYGRALQRDALVGSQTSQIGWIARQWAEHPSKGITPVRLHQILEDAERGNLVAQSDLFVDMEEKDGHIAAEMGKRKRAILTLDYEIIAPRNATPAENRETEMIREWFAELPDFEDMLLDMMDAVGHGFAAQEIEWHQTGRTWLPRSFAHRPQRWFQTPVDDGNVLRLRDGTAHGAEPWAFGWVIHRHKARSGYLTRAGLMRTLAWPYLYKNYGVRDLAEFLEIYGLPLRLGKYPAGATDAEKATLLRAVAAIGHNAAGIIPEGMLIEFQNAAQGVHDPFHSMIEWCERTQSKVILGGTLTSQADGASSTNALGNVHNEVRHDLLESDARQIAATIERDIIWPLRALNIAGADPRRSPRLRFDARQIADITTMATALPGLVGAGVQIPASWVHERLSIPQPQEGEAVLQMPQQAAGLGGLGSGFGGDMSMGFDALSARPNLAVLAAQSAPTSPTQAQAQRLAQNVAPTLDDWIDRIRDLVEQADSLETLRDGLLALAPGMSIDQYASAMQEALTAAALAGRADILEKLNA